MDGEAPAKAREQKVANQRAGWKTHILLLLCLLQAANTLKAPRLVSGKPGGRVTIQCPYTPSSINRNQRKYWCRLNTLTWVCHTIVSTNHYTHFRYNGRVALVDFPYQGLFVVRLSRLSPDDVGSYRCGIGNNNNMMFFSIKLTVSTGPPSPSPRATPAASELVTRSFGTAPVATNRGAPGTIQTAERQQAGWDKVFLTPGTSKRTASAKGVQTPGTPGVVALGTVSQVDSATWASIPLPKSAASATRGMSDTTAGVWLWGTESSVANRDRASEEGREATTEANRPREEGEKDRIALDSDWTVIGTIGPSTLASENWAWERRQEARLVSKPQDLGFLEETTQAAGMQTLKTTSTEMSSAEASTEGDLDISAGDSDPQAPTSQDLVAGFVRPPGKGSSMKSASPGEKTISWILTPVSMMLFLLTTVALVLLRRKLQRKRTAQETEKAAGVTLIQTTHFLELSRQPDQLPHVERKVPQDDSPSAHATITVPERDPGS